MPKKGPKVVPNQLSDIWYLAAPVMPRQPWESARSNLYLALEYQSCLMNIFVYTAMPWWTLVMILNDDDPAQRALGQKIALAQISGYTGVICCGPRMSRGMDLEVAYAEKLGLRTVDLTEVDPRDYGRVWGQS
jgi:hypothetical protein